MQRISVYIPEDTRKRINLVAKAKSRAESEVIRDALNEGLNVIYPRNSSAEALVNLAKLAKQIPTKGRLPSDVIKNMDYYTWGGSKRE